MPDCTRCSVQQSAVIRDQGRGSALDMPLPLILHGRVLANCTGQPKNNTSARHAVVITQHEARRQLDVPAKHGIPAMPNRHTRPCKSGPHEKACALLGETVLANFQDCSADIVWLYLTCEVWGTCRQARPLASVMCKDREQMDSVSDAEPTEVLHSQMSNARGFASSRT